MWGALAGTYSVTQVAPSKPCCCSSGRRQLATAEICVLVSIGLITDALAAAINQNCCSPSPTYQGVVPVTSQQAIKPNYCQSCPLHQCAALIPGSCEGEEGALPPARSYTFGKLDLRLDNCIQICASCPPGRGLPHCPHSQPRTISSSTSMTMRMRHHCQLSQELLSPPSVHPQAPCSQRLSQQASPAVHSGQAHNRNKGCIMLRM